MTGPGTNPGIEQAASDREFMLPVSEFDLPGTLDGGQAFRWHSLEDDDGYRGVVGRSVLEVRAAPDGLSVAVVSGPEMTPETSPGTAPGAAPGAAPGMIGVDAIRFYLGLDDDLEASRAKYASDPGLGPAMAGYLGLRLLRQDPWECLCGFICSATSNIPRIKLNMGALAASYGERVGPGPHDFAFPGPEAVATAGEQAVRNLAWGFRARYLEGAAKAVASGKFVLERLLDMSYEEAREALVTLDGIGPKIADCVLAFSLDKPQAFPVDRHIRRALEKWYGLPPALNNSKASKWARQRFGDTGAIAQQYMFHRERLARRAADWGGSHRNAALAQDA
ncbi:MAG: hypothetical protein IIB27_01905 [Chloroflexi bacterium]|nr:hypothetical protein [Chloroflexota bacterium]